MKTAFSLARIYIQISSKQSRICLCFDMKVKNPLSLDATNRQLEKGERDPATVNPVCSLTIPCQMILIIVTLFPAISALAQQDAELSLDRVRSGLWSRFGTVEQFAAKLKMPQAKVEKFLEEHRWNLLDAPALAFQNKKILPSSKEVNSFVTQKGDPASPATKALISSNERGITVSFVCEEPNPDGLVASYPEKDPLPDRGKWFRDGDLVALKKRAGFPRNRLGVRGTKISAPSVLLDDCVILFLTPVNIGQDRSNLFPAAFVPDPVKWLEETKPVGNESRVYLEGCYYAIVVNPNGAVLDLFFDPWDSGTVCPAWSSQVRVDIEVTGNTWMTKVQIPWAALKPTLNEGSVWGIDLARLRRVDDPAGVMTRSADSVFLRYDFPTPSPVLEKPGAVPEITLSLAKDVVDPFPDSASWSGSIWEKQATLDGFTNIRSGKKNSTIEAHLTHDAKTLFVRFDCREQDLTKLKVVTPEEELAEYGEGSRKQNYLDRREQFGLDWGDYVEVILSPNLEFSDRFHGGLFTFLVNSRGDLLERYYDSYGMNNVAPHPLWKSGARTRVTQSGGTWSVELAIPFDVLATAGKVSSTWGLNLHRCQSASASGAGEEHFLWSPLPDAIEVPGWPLSLRSLRDERRLGIMRLDPDTISPGPGKNRPGTAMSRSQTDAARTPAWRDRTGDMLSDIAFPDSRHGWAVGGLGTIRHTSDGGLTWDEQNSGTDFILEKAFFLDSKRGWIVGGWPRDATVSLYGGMGVILATRDGGKTWIKQLDGDATWLKDIFFLDKNKGWAVGEFGVVMKTSDGGKHWRQIKNTATRSWLYGITFHDTKHGVAIGHDETILLSHDGGESWTSQSSPVPRRANGWPSAYRAVGFSDSQHGWIVGDGGSILATQDGGESWKLESLDLSEAVIDLASFESLDISPNGTVRAVSPFVMMQKHPDEKTWKVVATGRTGMFRAVSFSDDSKGWLAGERGLVLHSSDGGISWDSQAESPREMGLLYATAHDHHLNNAPLSVVSEEYDSAYVCLSRGVRAFELDGDYNRNMVAASAMATGVSTVHSFVEFSWRLRDKPHNIAQRYQNYGGIEGVERRLVAMIRTLKPRILMAEQPVLQENYYAHGVGEIARAQILAFDSAADPEKFPELLALGLKPHAAEKLYIITNWATELYDIHPVTLRVPASAKTFSERLGMTHGEARARSKNCFWGMLDRALPPISSTNIGPWNLHLKKWRGKIDLPEKALFQKR